MTILPQLLWRDFTQTATQSQQPAVLPSIKKSSFNGPPTLRFEKAWFMEEPSRRGGEGGWEIMPECPTATFFLRARRLNPAVYLSYFSFLLKLWQDGWQVAACMAIGKTKVAGIGAATATPPIWNVSSSWQGLLSPSLLAIVRMSNEWPASGGQRDGTERPLLLSVFIMHT